LTSRLLHQLNLAVCGFLEPGDVMLSSIIPNFIQPTLIKISGSFCPLCLLCPYRCKG